MDGDRSGEVLDSTEPLRRANDPYAWQQHATKLLFDSGMLARARSLYLCDLSVDTNVSSLVTAASSTLQELAFYAFEGEVAPYEVLQPSALLNSCPALHTLIVNGVAEWSPMPFAPCIADIVTAVLSRTSPLDTWMPLSGRPISKGGLRRLYLDHCGNAAWACLFPSADLDEQHRYATLEHLHIGEKRGVVIPYAIPNLRTLSLNDARTLGPLLDRDSPERQQLHDLHTLRFGTMPYQEWSRTAAIMEAIDSPRTLCSILMDGNGLTPFERELNDQFMALIRRHPNIETLSMDRDAPHYIIELLPDLRNLKHLSVAKSVLHRTFLEQVTEHLVNLETLDVSNNNSITAMSLIGLVKARGGGIKELGIQGCQGLGPHELLWLRDLVPRLITMGRQDRLAVRPRRFWA